MLELDRLRELLVYEPDTGNFYWRVSVSNVRAGQKAGDHAGRGYWRVRIDNKRYRASRLAWFYMTGEFPSEVDHINGDPSDNRFKNLRPCTHAQNLMNRKSWGRASKGVSRRGCKWAARIAVNGERKYLGEFPTEAKAAEAYAKAAAHLHGEYARAQ